MQYVAGVAHYRRSSIAELRAHEHGLTAMNWAETHPGEPFALDWAAYERAESAGLLDVVAAWEGERMVGYCVSVLTDDPQNGQRHAVSAGLYACPGPRAGFVVRQLTRLARELSRAAGALSFRVELPVESRLAPVLLRDGFAHCSETYARAL